MASKRNRILELTNYLESCGIDINIGKNKAKGNKGFFYSDGKFFRIDIAKNLSEEAILNTLAHEFAHYVHYSYDKTLKKLDFIFEDTDEVEEELIEITVASITKKNIEPLFCAKDNLKQEISQLTNKLKHLHKDFNANISSKFIESKIKKTDLKYLLKHDNVKVFNGFSYKNYTIDNLSLSNDIELYLALKSKQRALKRINSKLSRLNKYYNLPTELFARAFELYITKPQTFAKIAPNLYNSFNETIKTNKIPLLSNFTKILL